MHPSPRVTEHASLNPASDRDLYISFFPCSALAPEYEWRMIRPYKQLYARASFDAVLQAILMNRSRQRYGNGSSSSCPVSDSMELFDTEKQPSCQQ